jgi:hypothetical protein
LVEEILTWLGVAGAAAFAWGLYVFGEDQSKTGSVEAKETTSEE